MKAGIIDLFVDSFGWVLGKTLLFALAVMGGLAIGGFGLWAATQAVSGEFAFQAGGIPVFHHLSWVTALLPQILLLFWAGMVFVRSEMAEMKHWGQVAAIQALLMVGCFARALPDGMLPQILAWGLTLGGIAGLFALLRKIGSWQLNRGMDHLARLEELNNARRAEMKEKFGTENTSARELGIL